MKVVFVEMVTEQVKEEIEEKLPDGEKSKRTVVKDVLVEVPTEFETHPHELLVSMVSRYTKARKLKIPHGAVAWVVRLKNGELLSLLKTVKENKVTEETKLVLEAA